MKRARPLGANREAEPTAGEVSTGRVPVRSLLRYGDFRVGVSSDDRSHLAWLEEFLAPSFSVERRAPHTPSDANCEVALRLDAREYERLRARGPAGGRVDLMALDVRIITLPLWSSGSPSRVVIDEESGVFFEVDQKSRRIGVLASSAESLSRAGYAVRVALMRAVRELTMNCVSRDGVFLHAAAFAVGDAGVLVAGPKRAGKTTLLLHALSSISARLLANDRVFVSFSEDGPAVRGMPTIVTIREGTLSLFPGIRANLMHRGFHTGLTVAEAAGLTEAGSAATVGPASDGRFGLTGKQLCTLMGTEQVPRMRLDGILFPRVCRHEGPMRLERMTASKALRRLEGSVFGAGRRPATDALFDLDADSGRGAADPLAACRRLAAELPCFVCDVGPRSYELHASADALIERFG